MADDEAHRYGELAANVADAWRTEFLAEEGTTTPDTQATYARALTFGLIPDDLRTAASARLVDLIRDAGTHLSTGFLATPFLHQYIGGLRPLEPGYRRFRVRPQPGRGITWAKVHHDAPGGRIEVRWSVSEAGAGAIDVVVPDETQAELVLPDGTTATLVPGTHQRTWSSS